MESLSCLLEAAYAHEHSGYVAGGILLAVVYSVYYWYCRRHRMVDRGTYDIRMKNIGRTIPPFPNGWYVACRSEEVPKGESLAADLAGHNVTVFRDQQGKLYALHSYCAHLGANLGIGGKVVNGNCIECPFHGWLYDGDTGTLVGKSSLTQIMIRTPTSSGATSTRTILVAKAARRLTGRQRKSMKSVSVSTTLVRTMDLYTSGSMLIPNNLLNTNTSMSSHF